MSEPTMEFRTEAGRSLAAWSAGDEPVPPDDWLGHIHDIEKQAAELALTAAAGRIEATALRHGINPEPFLDALSAEGEQ